MKIEKKTDLSTVGGNFIMFGLTTLVIGVGIMWGVAAGVIACGATFVIYGAFLAHAGALDKERDRKDAEAGRRISEN